MFRLVNGEEVELTEEEIALRLAEESAEMNAAGGFGRRPDTIQENANE